VNNLMMFGEEFITNYEASYHAVFPGFCFLLERLHLQKLTSIRALLKNEERMCVTPKSLCAAFGGSRQLARARTHVHTHALARARTHTHTHTHGTVTLLQSVPEKPSGRQLTLN
jgi:hypothetical protein